MGSQSVQVTNAIRAEQKPKWLDSLMERVFFGPCESHRFTRNELNTYCIDCDTNACRFCIGEGKHSEHRKLKIYRHVYKHVVAMNDLKKHIDCSKIQCYKCNKQLVIALKPLPHSGTLKNGDSSCVICKRILLDPKANDFCSMDCKVKGFLAKESNYDPPFIAIKPESKRKRSRKWTPYRAPLF